MERIQINKITKNNKISNINNLDRKDYQKREDRDIKNNKLHYTSKNIHILLFYKFYPIKDVEYSARKNKSFCRKLGVLGKILIAKEGINGSISGTKEQVEKYKEFIHSQKGFEDVKFKEETAFEHPFTKMHVRIRNEIVSLKQKINIKNKGEYLTPKEFLEIYNNEIIDSNKINNQRLLEREDGQTSKSTLPKNKILITNNKNNSNINITNNKLNDNKKENEVIILDARNYYEYELGRFKNAIHGNIKTFREFPKFVEKFKKNLSKNFTEKEIKNKKIIMYCTGGIRCEKASAYMREQGFNKVYQLEGGIINFCQQFPSSSDNIWEGKCFVFDKRLMTDLNQNNKPISRCVNCKKLCDLYRNCKNLKCDKLVILCVNCQNKLQGCCSKECLLDFLNYARKRAELKKIGKWKPKEVLQNYVK